MEVGVEAEDQWDGEAGETGSRPGAEGDSHNSAGGKQDHTGSSQGPSQENSQARYEEISSDITIIMLLFGYLETAWNNQSNFNMQTATLSQILSR